MKIGIDRIGFYTSHYFLDLASLARARGVDVEKYYTGLGQEKMAVCAPDEDVVTLAANAAASILTEDEIGFLDTVIFATETGIDQSKAAGIYVKGLLGLPQRIRVIEVKQACYSATAALQFAAAWIYKNPSRKVLVLSSDIARYGFNTAGESSQGCGALAMLVSANPRILELESGSGLYTEDVMDFWRPNYRDEALVEGHYSTQVYLDALTASWQHYQEETGRSFDDHGFFCYHTPVPKLVEKAHARLCELNGVPCSRESVRSDMDSALQYGRASGNAYSAALYISLASLLDNESQDMSGQRIGFYSYGSGCVAEFFSGVVQPGYRRHLITDQHRDMLASRKELTYEEYEAFYSFQLPKNGGECHAPSHAKGLYRLTGIKDHKRLYDKINIEVCELSRQVKALSPGKLILSGEHAVLYGKPALAMAIDRYTETCVSQQDENEVSVNLVNLNYSHSHTSSTLAEMKDRIKTKYKQFLQGKLRIRDVLQAPFELTQYALARWLEHPQSLPSSGIHLHTSSTIPVGCGMGSSAASVLSVLRALAAFHRIDLKSEDIFRLALEAEQLQHGQTTGFDLHISLYGGCVYLENGLIESRSVPTLPMWLVNTGAPVVSTGECVQQVKERFADSPIWDTFAAVTRIMDRALQAGDMGEVCSAVRDNHQLLVKIGVVPAKVQTFIHHLEEQGFSAKVCGSGAVLGDQAGAVLVLGKEAASLEKLCHQYQYTLEEIKPAKQGLHVV